MGKNVYKYHQLSYILSCCIFFRHNLMADYDNTIILSTCCIVWIHTGLWYISAHIQSYTYTSVFQRVLLDSKGWCKRHPLSSIQHPLEDPGISIHTLASWEHFFWCFFFPAVSPNQCDAFPRWSRAMEPTKVQGGKANGETSHKVGVDDKMMIYMYIIYI